ncbi:hypothetical protein VCM52_001175 [Escherichia coli]|nr:hypothetical protein [Escherichia coli]EMC3009630.1 hypothetical protein [Escherichia coli]EMC6800466.1 hypothetical protein [Escherichia coli]
MTTQKEVQPLATEQIKGEPAGEVVRPTLDHEAGLVRDLLVQRYREFGSEKFEERANELVDCVRHIYARLAAPVDAAGVESDINLTVVNYDTKTIDEAS